MHPAVAGPPKLLSFHIYDPLARLNVFLDPATHLARKVPRWSGSLANGELGAAVPARNSLIAGEDLGTQSMENVSVHGVRKSTIVPATVSGTGKPVIVTDETWYSEELHRLNMLIKHNDPRTGQQTVTVTHVDRNEPNPTMFQIPASYS